MSDQTPLSLLERLRAQPVDSDSWSRFVDLYTTWLESWLWRLARLPEGDHDAAEVIQNVFLVVCREFRAFRHNGRLGAFRAWLRKVLVNCLRDHFKQKRREVADDFGHLLERLEDPNSQLSRLWDEEHQAHVVGRLLERGQKRFTRYTWEVFQRTVLDGQQAAHVAAELGVSVNAVLLAKARVLAWLRREAGDVLE